MPKRDKHIKTYKLKNGETRYWFQAYLGTNPMTGKPVQVTRKKFTSYNEAKDTYDQLIAQGTKGYVKPKQKTVDEVYKLWFENYQKEVKESTANKTNINYRIHIKPIFGSDYIDQLSSEKFQLFVNELANKLVKYKEIINKFNELYKYGAAMKFCKPEDNPVNMVLIPRKTSRKRRDISKNYYTLEELQEFLSIAKKHNFKYYVYFMLLATTGLRKSEALALNWSDIDWIHKTVKVTKTLAIGLNNKLIIQAPKSADSKRPTPLTDHMISVLKEYRKEDKLVSPIIFHGLGNKYVAISKPQRWLDLIYKANPDLRQITIHGFRHTYATLNKGQDIKDVQAVMGHADILMTEHYTHSTPEGRERIRSHMNSLNI